MSWASRTSAVGRSWVGLRAVRVLAWGMLLAATGMLVRAEARRSDWPEGVSADTDVVYRRTPERRLRLDVYQPDASVPMPDGGRPAVLAIHGGGWCGGSKLSFGRMAARLAQHGYVVISVEYTLSRPGQPSWPAALDDMREAVRWTRQHAREYGIDPTRLVAFGASAGGHLAALLGVDPAARVQAVVDFYGPAELTGLATGTPSAAPIIAQFLGGTPDEIPEQYEAASPARHVSATSAPMLLVHGEDDAHVPPSQSEALARALRDAGVPNRLILVPGSRHGFELRLDERRDLLPDVLAFLETVWNASPRAPAR